MIIESCIECDRLRGFITNDKNFKKYSIGRKLYVFRELLRIKEYNFSWIKTYLEVEYDNFPQEMKESAIKIMLRLGSLKAIQYLVDHKDKIFLFENLIISNYKVYNTPEKLDTCLS